MSPEQLDEVMRLARSIADSPVIFQEPARSLAVKVEPLITEIRRLQGLSPVGAGVADEHMIEVLRALEDLSFECFSPIAPPNRPSLQTYNRTFDVLDKQRKRLGIHPQSMKSFQETERLPMPSPPTDAGQPGDGQ